MRFVRCVSPMPLAHAEYLARVAVALRRGPRPDVLNLHSQPEGLVLAKALRCPAMLFYDDYFFRRTGGKGWRHQGYRRLLRSFDRLLPCSEYCLERSVEYWNLNAARRDRPVQRREHGTVQTRPPRRAGPNGRASAIDGPVVLYVGRVNEQKGTDLLIESISLLRQRGGEATLVVAGPISQFGERAPGATSVLGATDLRGRRCLPGRRPEDQLAAVYAMADVFVMPTRAHRDVRHGGSRSTSVRRPRRGQRPWRAARDGPRSLRWTLPGRERGRVGAQVQGLLDNDDLRRRCSEAAIANAARFDWERVTSDLHAAYARQASMPDQHLSIAMPVRDCGSTVGARSAPSWTRPSRTGTSSSSMTGPRTIPSNADRSFYDDRIRVHSDGHSLGLAARLNQAIELASGDYLARMDGDDIAYPARLER